MNKQLINNFLKDRINVIGLFGFNSAALILFFNMEQGTRKEILYPLILSFFMLALLMLTEWLKYYRFNLNLMKLQDNLSQELRPITLEQNQIDKIKKTAFRNYTSEINSAMNQNKNRNYFLSQWIHNLKTPISVIDLISQKDSIDNKDPYDVIADIRHENMRLYSSVEQVLAIIRLEDFEKDYEPQAVDLVYTIKKLLNSRKKQLIHSNIMPEIICDNDAEEIYVLTDKKWNELMLDQVFSNAIKYSKQGKDIKKIQIIISKEEGKTILSIRDEGIGIPTYDIERVFEPFFTGENGRKHRDSTGIGLYVCSQIAARLGHTISIKSEMMSGTSVEITYITKL